MYIVFYMNHIFQVTVRQNNGSIRSMRIRNDELQNVCKSIGSGKNLEQISKAIFAQDGLNKLLQELFLKKVNSDCKSLGKSKSPVLKNKSPHELASLELSDIPVSWEQESSLFVPVLKAVTGVSPDQKLPADVVFGGATLLRHRSREMSQLHYATGLILDHGGATDEVKYCMVTCC